MTLTVDNIKAYLRITHNVDDNFITSLIETSRAFIKEQTGVEFIAGDKVYEQCVLFLVAHLYDNRASVTEKAITEVPYTLDALIRHIKIRGSIEAVEETLSGAYGGENDEQG